MTLEHVYICDIDGTAAKMVDRSPYDYTKVLTDVPNDPMRTILYALHKFGYGIIYVSGRPGTEQCHRDTKAWLVRHSFPRGELFMRGADDRRPDNIVKQEIYDTLIKPKYTVLAVFDDRDRVVKQWRSNGLMCLQVAEGDF